MMFNTVAFSALLLGSATATILHERSLEDGVSALYKRQYQFQPGTQTATGNTCADAFGSGYTMCREHTATLNRLCYNPTAGQTCCSSSWACPNGSGCSATSAGSYCCPNGQDAKSCAAAKAVSSSTSSSSSASKTKISSSAVPTAYNYAVPPSYSVKNITSSSASKVATIAATATGTYPTASASAKAPVQFEGAASSLRMSFSGLMGAAFLGVMATIF
ncbi:putative D-lactate dehydrogenase [Venturia nashicola]|nr:putative D-lactate dehydrogenase [Venturia nashicola]